MGISFLKGLHYRHPVFYEACAWIKLKEHRHKRYQEAARYVDAGESVLDVCAGTGEFRKFLPFQCSYAALEASPQFSTILRHQEVKVIQYNLHEGWPQGLPRVDVLVMIISLAQFRKTSINDLLDGFKKTARRVVIVEEILKRPRSENSFYQRTVNYLCSTDYYVPVAWYTQDEFSSVTDARGYQFKKIDQRYCVATYEH